MTSGESTHANAQKEVETFTSGQNELELPEQESALSDVINRAKVDSRLLTAEGIMKLQRTIGNQAVRRLLENRAGKVILSPTQGIQRKIKYEGTFSSEASEALEAIQAADSNLNDKDKEYKPLFNKLDALPNTTVTFKQQGALNGETALYFRNPSVEDNKLTNITNNLSPVIAINDRQQTKFFLNITIYAPQFREPKKSLTTGYLTQVLTHELALHVENYADFIIGYFAGKKFQAYKHPTEAEEHQSLLTVENKRYYDLKTQILNTGNDAKLKEGFDEREMVEDLPRIITEGIKVELMKQGVLMNEMKLGKDEGRLEDIIFQMKNKKIDGLMEQYALLNDLVQDDAEKKGADRKKAELANIYSSIILLQV